jgi:hypothetical protein
MAGTLAIVTPPRSPIIAPYRKAGLRRQREICADPVAKYDARHASVTGIADAPRNPCDLESCVPQRMTQAAQLIRMSHTNVVESVTVVA